MPLDIGRKRTLATLSLLAAAIFAGSPSASAQDAQGLAGEWRFQSADGKKKCALALRNAPSGAGFALGAPATCRRSMRALDGAVGWTAPGADRIDLLDKAGAPTLSFAMRDGVLTASGADGQTYRLVRSGETTTASITPGFQPVTAGAKPGFSQAAASAPPAGPSVRAADIPGRYAILRDVNRDTGCMLTLETTPRGGAARAQLAPACRDNGISIFEPVAWSFSGGKLALTARKGHRAHFVMTPDGSWQKDPKESGKPLGFRKM